MESEVEGLVSDTFQFMLEAGGSFEFRWDPPKNQELVLSATVFRVTAEGDMVLRQEGEENEFVSLQVRKQGSSLFNPIGNFYVQKTFRINFDTDFKDVRFVSELPNSVLIVVYLEKLKEVVAKGSIASD